MLQELNAHPLGLTVTNLRYNKETLTLSTRIFYGDFYAEFQNYTKVKRKDYVKTGLDANDRKDFIAYFKKNIRLWINRSEIHFKTIKINFEPHEEDAYILLIDLTYEADILPGAKIKLRDTVLLNTIVGQKHMVNVYLKDPTMPSHGILTLDKGTPECVFIND